MAVTCTPTTSNNGVIANICDPGVFLETQNSITSFPQQSSQNIYILFTCIGNRIILKLSNHQHYGDWWIVDANESMGGLAARSQYQCARSRKTISIRHYCGHNTPMALTYRSLTTTHVNVCSLLGVSSKTVLFSLSFPSEGMMLLFA